MISGLSNTNLQSVLYKMDHSPFIFQLTGSRFFGGYNEMSDHDFFVQDSVQIRGWLEDNGFKRDKKSYHYGSRDIVDVYKNKVGIHVQIVHDFDIKLKAEIILKKLWRYLPEMKHHKTHRRTLWNDALDLVRLLNASS